jgi:serine/threonine protein kinase
MALAPGTSLGHYNVSALIGEEGMGQVWQATATQLNRQVALKILPDAFAEEPDRLARFQREAQVPASLNHPNIASIHGIEKSGDTQALVLELVEGPTLADRIATGAIPVDEALPIATQIAEALEAAHEAGVIHRDLKHANIKVREDGSVKVLDFGLAKALQTAPAGDPDQSPTLTAAATQMGVIMGTAAYMSPEQARARRSTSEPTCGHSSAVCLSEGLTLTVPNRELLFFPCTQTKGKIMAKLFCRSLFLALCMLVWFSSQGHAQTGFSDHTLTSAGAQRSYVLYLPENAGNDPLPVVFSLHGSGYVPQAQVDTSEFADLADQHGFAVVFPAGTFANSGSPVAGMPILKPAWTMCSLSGT